MFVQVFSDVAYHVLTCNSHYLCTYCGKDNAYNNGEQQQNCKYNKLGLIFFGNGNVQPFV